MSNRARPILESLTSDEVAALRARVDGLFDRSGGPDACWPYTPPGAGSFTTGYPVIYTTTSAKTRRMVKLHRLIFELVTGESPPSVDHLCHDSHECKLSDTCPHRRCGNPAHLAASTVGENASRARRGVFRHEDRCGSGLHLRNDDNTYEAPDGALRCRPCDAERARTAREEVRAQRPARERKRHYRPRGMTKEQLVDWALGDQPLDACCRWPDLAPNDFGYVGVHFQGRVRNAHILVFEAKHGSIPSGHVIDHVCHNPRECEGGPTCPHRSCINPLHLVSVTRGFNSGADRSRRSSPTHCGKGHEFTPKNTYTDKRGSRRCRTCQRERMLARYHANREGMPDSRHRRDGKCANGHDVTVEGALDQYNRCRKCKQAARARSRAKKPPA